MLEYFRFSKKEWVATIFLLVVLVVFFVISNFFKVKVSTKSDLATFKREIAAFEVSQQKIADSISEVRALLKQNYKSYSKTNYPSYPKYNFPEKNNSKITAFIPDSLREDRGTRNSHSIKKMYQLEKVDLNSCDTSDIVKVPQFGSKRALNIIEYREKLGGFYDLSQLLEIYSLQNFELAYLEKYFFVDKEHIKKLAVNHASYKELIQHPYMDSYLVKTIIQYREKKKNIDSIKEFKQCTQAYQELIERLSPYLSFE